MGFIFAPSFQSVRLFRDGCQVLGSKPDLLAALFALTSDDSVAIARDCYHIFVNLSADKALHQVSGNVQHGGEQQHIRREEETQMDTSGVWTGI